MRSDQCDIWLVIEAAGEWRLEGEGGACGESHNPQTG